MHLDAAQLLERVDDGVLVGAERERHARVVEPARRTDAVREVALGRRAEARGGTGAREEGDVGVGQVGRVDRGRRRPEQPLPGQQLGRRAAVEALAGEVLPGLLREVHVEGALPLRGEGADRTEVVARHRAHRVHGDSDPGGLALVEGRDPVGPGPHAPVGEALLDRVEREVTVGGRPPAR